MKRSMEFASFTKHADAAEILAKDALVNYAKEHFPDQAECILFMATVAISVGASAVHAGVEANDINIAKMTQQLVEALWQDHAADLTARLARSA